MLLSAFIPDSLQIGSIDIEVIAYQWPNSIARSTGDYTVNEGDGRQSFGQEGRFWQYKISGNALGQSWRMGQWGEELQQSGDGQ